MNDEMANMVCLAAIIIEAAAEKDCCLEADATYNTKH